MPIVVVSSIINNVLTVSQHPIIDVAIVGGGAAGLASAIFTARRAPQASIVVLDGAKKIGAKILIAGGGRCNVTNQQVGVSDYCGGNPSFIKRVIAKLSVENTISFFREIGVELKVEEHGKLFPTTNKARTVLEALLSEANRCGVSIRCGQCVTSIQPVTDGFEIQSSDTTLHARKVVLAAGGQAMPKTGSDGSGYELAKRLGHSLVPMTPALVPLCLSGDFHTPLSGIAHDVEMMVQAEGCKLVRVFGALLWTHFGVSGPVVLDASRYWHRARHEGRGVNVTVSLLPGKDFAAIERLLLDLATQKPKSSLKNVLPRLLPARLAEAMLQALNIDGDTVMSHLPKDVRRQLVHALSAWPLPIHDSRGYAYAEVTAGGVSLSEVQPKTMASRKCPGLYLIGEILDVDGRIGGYNFQWAWSSAYTASAALAP